jgi:AcrR family transcriptional regulator
MMAVAKLTQERRRAMTREALVQAARTVFVRKGFNGASLDEIAEEAGFTRGAIYSNFDGKEDLLVAVLEHYNEEMLGPYGAMLEARAGDEPEDRAAEAAGIWQAQIDRDPELQVLWLELRLYAVRNPSFRPKLAEFSRRNLERVARFMEHEAFLTGLEPLVPIEDIASIGLWASEGLAQQTMIDPDNADRYKRLVEELFNLMAHLFEVRGPEAASGGGGR